MNSSSILCSKTDAIAACDFGKDHSCSSFVGKIGLSVKRRSCIHCRSPLANGSYRQISLWRLVPPAKLSSCDPTLNDLNIVATAVNVEIVPDSASSLCAALNIMKTSTARWQICLGLCCAATLVTGCALIGGSGAYPGGYPGPAPGGYPPVAYLPDPGGIPWYNVGYPRFPGSPGIPVVLNPAPFPGSPPGPPLPAPNPIPGPTPGPTPTIPVGLPGPEVPGDNYLDFWSPWPLPPRGSSSSAATNRSRRSVNKATVGRRNSRALQVSQSADHYRALSRLGGGDVGQLDLIDDNSPASDHELKYHGGRIIRELSYVNLYVSGDTKWSRTDVEQIDNSLSAAMRDEHLNNVLLQYFDNQPIRSTALPSHPLVGYTPKTVTRGDIQNMIAWLHRQGFLRSFDLQNTVFNLLLPSGSVLTVENRASIAVSDEVAGSGPGPSNNAVPESEEGDSLTGLAGYHGSVVTASNERVYYAVSVYSEKGVKGTTNGIPVFPVPWKNVVATLYHQLVESRTNPDVEEAMRNSSDETAKQNLGWVSDSGLELGDVPILANIPLSSVFQEVPLANGSGVVPVQLPWSNAIHGPEGPISQPHPLP